MSEISDKLQKLLDLVDGLGGDIFEECEYDVIVDIDGTIADNEHRSVHLKQHPKNWDKYNENMHLDKPHDDIMFVIRSLYLQGANIILCTGRSEDEREVTENWLRDNNFYYHEKLYMRKSKDYRDDTVIKAELYDQMLEDGFKPSIVFEDRQKVVDMWRAKGLRCLQVNYGDF